MNDTERRAAAIARLRREADRRLALSCVPPELQTAVRARVQQSNRKRETTTHGR